MTPSQKLRSIADSTGLDGIADAIREIANEIEHNNAPAVPQGNDPAWTLAAKVREALDRKACPGYYMDVAVEAVVHNYSYATPAPAPAVPQGWRDFLTELSKQKPEKPDYWSSCGQCERNSSTAEDLLAATPAPAPAQEVATLSLAAEDVHAAFTKNFPKSRISQAWINFAADIAQAIAARAAKPAQEVGLTDEQADAVSMALRRAWQLGQTYWQQADSDYISQHKKSEETQRKFEKLCDDTIAALRAKGGKL